MDLVRVGQWVPKAPPPAKNEPIERVPPERLCTVLGVPVSHRTPLWSIGMRSKRHLGQGNAIPTNLCSATGGRDG